MSHTRITYLLKQHMAGTLTEAELEELEAIATGTQHEQLLEEIARQIALQEEGKSITLAEAKAALVDIVSVDKESSNTMPANLAAVRLLKTAWFRYAAAILLLCGIGAYLWFNNFEKPPAITTTNPALEENDVPPGHDGAILTLADGTKLVLDSMGNGIIAQQDGSQVELKDGQLIYDPSGKPRESIAYNTIYTPRGRQFKVTLPDGTHVWLNSASSIRYPVIFTGNERMVDIIGEAFFAVAKDSKKPFRVKVNDNTEIQVFGTSFNINAYENEVAIETTLLEGAVRINAFNQTQTLKPGQQARVTIDERINLVNDADIEKSIAWKNGYFSFKDSDLYEVMRQLERWYDIEVMFAKPIPAIEFSGELPRDLSLSQILEILTKMKVKFKIEKGRKLIIES